MKESIRNIESSDKLNKEEGRKIKTKLWVKIMKMHKIKNIIIIFFSFISINCLELMLQHSLKTVFTT